MEAGSISSWFSNVVGDLRIPNALIADFQSVRVADPQLFPLWISDPQGLKVFRANHRIFEGLTLIMDSTLVL